MKKTIVIAPHPDDETLGCGGSLYKHAASGDEIYWVIVTSMDELNQYTEQQKATKQTQINTVAIKYGFKGVFPLGFPTTQLDDKPMSDIIGKISEVFKKVAPNTVYCPYRLDAHSDHQITFDATLACTKTFRYPSIKTIRLYETQSETDFGLRPENTGFRPNTFIDISDFLEQKLQTLALYEGELGEHPFPRSIESVKALAILRGAAANCHYAEAFMTIKEII